MPECAFNPEPSPFETGLRQSREVQQQFHAIDNGLEIVVPGKYGFTWQVPDSEETETSSEIQENYLREAAEDSGDFGLRVQQLKVRLLKHYLRGAYAYENKGKGYEEKERTFSGRLGKEVVKLKIDLEKGEASPQDKASLTAEINKRIPRQFSLKNDKLGKYDVKQLYDLTFALESGEPLDEDTRKEFEALLNEAENLEGELQISNSQFQLFSEDQRGFVGEARTRELWNRYRTLLKKAATLEESGSWFSPTYGSSGEGQRGKHQSSEPRRTDYQRWGMQELKSLERKLHDELFRDSRYEEHAQSLLFPSGIAAFQATLLFIDKVASQYDLNGPVFKTQDIYYEVDSIIERHYDERNIKPTELDPSDAEGMVRRIKESLPSVIFLNPMSNMYDMKVAPVTRILEALGDEEWQRTVERDFISGGITRSKMIVVIDNSTLGRLAKWKEFDFGKLPRFVDVIAIESLIKYAQDGQELSQAGLVTAIGDSTAHEFERIRRERGFMPTENTVRKLEATIPGDMLDRKMERHSRNATLVAQKINAGLKDLPGESIIKEVVFPGVASHAQHEELAREAKAGGGLLNLGLNLEFLKNYKEKITSASSGREVPRNEFKHTAEDITQAFNRLIILLAQKVGLEINEGTSYGFHTTRMAIYNRILSDKEEPDHYYQERPYIRVATGTENIKDALLIAEIFNRANAIFSWALDNQRILTLTEIILKYPETLKFGSGSKN